ncbi:MAG: hypothetical protein ACXWXH_10355 [Aeromicrobium sp.]
MSDHLADVRIVVFLVCFAGHKRAAKVRRAIRKRICESGDSILDEALIRVDLKHRIQVHDPRTVAAGTMTAGLTWGLFGLATGGLESFGLWAVLGVISGGLFAYYSLNRVTKDERRRIGEHLPADSSALALFVQGSDPERILASAAPFEPKEASVAAIGSDLSTRVYSNANGSADTTAAPAGTSAPAAQLSMLLVRFKGQHSARQALATTTPAKDTEPDGPQVELVVEANERGKRRVADPTMGPAAVAKADIVSWGTFGLVYGALAGFVGNGGISGVIESSLGWAIACGVFGIVAGALFGLWASRSVSAARLKGIGALVPPDSSMVLGWATNSVSAEAIDGWIASSSQQLVVRIVADESGLLLDVTTS